MVIAEPELGIRYYIIRSCSFMDENEREILAAALLGALGGLDDNLCGLGCRGAGGVAGLAALRRLGATRRMDRAGEYSGSGGAWRAGASASVSGGSRLAGMMA